MPWRIAGLFCLMLSLGASAVAQSVHSESNSAASEETAESMEPPLPGDHWAYEFKDEIAGTVKGTSSNVITDVSPTEISLRAENIGRPGISYWVYDRLWNVKSGPIWKFSPHDGTGIKLPLKVGSTWQFQSKDTFTARAGSFRRSGSSKIVGEESITTHAGTFQAYRIETSIKMNNIADPSKSSTLAMTTWYVPSINHWVKRTSKITTQGHVIENYTVDLIEYGRR